MKISFRPLLESDFPQLLKWLRQPHVQKWWDTNVLWTLSLVEEKYKTYVQGYKLEKGDVKKIQAMIICYEDRSIGYIQCYNAYDFTRVVPLINLPNSLICFDMYIGEEDYLDKGIGFKALDLFLKSYENFNKSYVFVDPDLKNITAIKLYEKVGFKMIQQNLDHKNQWMLLNIAELKK